MSARRSLSLALCLAPLLVSCGDKADGGEGAGDDVDDEHIPVDCVSIDRLEGFTVPPAGIGLGFRVLDCDGNPLINADGSHRQLQASQISVINDETGQDFNDSSEGGAVSDPGTPDNVRVYAMLVLDFSRSIFEAGNEQSVVDGALSFIDATLVNNDSELSYEIGIIAFGGPDQTELVADFTDSPTELQQALSDAVAAGSRGTTDLYGAYMMGLEELADQGASASAAGELVERVAVVWSDGAHEAGNTEQLRGEALTARDALEGSPFTIYLDGDDTAQDALCELAKNEASCFAVQEASELEAVFETISERAEAIAQSNYVVGVCTPVALGDPSFTLEVTVDGVTGTEQGWYSTDELTGDVDSCDPEQIKDYYQEWLSGGGTGGESGGGDDGGGEGGGDEGGGDEGGDDGSGGFDTSYWEDGWSGMCKLGDTELGKDLELYCSIETAETGELADCIVEALGDVLAELTVDGESIEMDDGEGTFAMRLDRVNDSRASGTCTIIGVEASITVNK